MRWHWAWRAGSFFLPWHCELHCLPTLRQIPAKGKSHISRKKERDREEGENSGGDKKTPKKESAQRLDVHDVLQPQKADMRASRTTNVSGMDTFGFSPTSAARQVMLSYRRPTRNLATKELFFAVKLLNSARAADNRARSCTVCCSPPGTYGLSLLRCQ